MNDLIWIGNTLYPRGVVFLVVGIVVVVIVGLWVVLTDGSDR